MVYLMSENALTVLRNQSIKKLELMWPLTEKHLNLELVMFCECTCLLMFITDTEADLTEIVNRVHKSTHQAVTEIEVQLFYVCTT